MQDALFTTHHLLEERHWWFRARRRAIVELGTALLPAGGRVVDAGCGTGADIAAFPSAYPRCGIDRSAQAIELAKRRHDGVRFEVAELPAGDGEEVGSADLVLLCDVLEHIEDDRGVLRWLLATMKPGAHLLLTVPADPALWSPHDEVYGHHRRYTAESLSALWKDEAVRERLLSPFNRILYPAARAVRAVARRRGRALGDDRGDLIRMPWPINRLLVRLFALEVSALRTALESGAGRRGGRGVSLIAVLRKEAS